MGWGEPSCPLVLPAPSCFLQEMGEQSVHLCHQASPQFCVCVSSSVMSDSATAWTVACPAPLSKGFSRQECWSGLPFPSPRHFLCRLFCMWTSLFWLPKQFSFLLGVQAPGVIEAGEKAAQSSSRRWVSASV